MCVLSALAMLLATTSARVRSALRPEALIPMIPNRFIAGLLREWLR